MRQQYVKRIFWKALAVVPTVKNVQAVAESAGRYSHRYIAKTLEELRTHNTFQSLGDEALLQDTFDVNEGAARHRNTSRRDCSDQSCS